MNIFWKRLEYSFVIYWSPTNWSKYVFLFLRFPWARMLWLCGRPRDQRTSLSGDTVANEVTHRRGSCLLLAEVLTPIKERPARWYSVLHHFDDPVGKLQRMRDKGKAKGKAKAKAKARARDAKSLPSSSSSSMAAQKVISAIASLGERNGSSAHSIAQAMDENDELKDQSQFKSLLLKAVKMGKVSQTAKNQYVLHVALEPHVLRNKHTSRSQSRGRRRRSSQGKHRRRQSRCRRKQSRSRRRKVGPKRKAGRYRSWILRNSRKNWIF